METNEFKKNLLQHLIENKSYLQDENKNWSVKGFVDTSDRIYTINCDTKVLSKVLELMIFPILSSFAKEHDFTLEYAKEQNHYPDSIFINNKTGEKYAVDLKTTYRKNEKKVNGFTLGAFTGYFRNRDSQKNIAYTYNSYKAHLVLGIIYSKNETEESEIYDIDELKNISSTICDFDFIVQEKYRLASYTPGSGNTKNIGSITDIEKLKLGKGPFYELGEEDFDDYWMSYMTKGMTVDKIVPYSNIETYKEYKKITSIYTNNIEED